MKIIVVLSGLAIVAPGFAQEAPQPGVGDPATIVVTADRTPQPIYGTAAHTTVLDKAAPGRSIHADWPGQA